MISENLDGGNEKKEGFTEEDFEKISKEIAKEDKSNSNIKENKNVKHIKKVFLSIYFLIIISFALNIVILLFANSKINNLEKAMKYHIQEQMLKIET